MSKIVLSCLIKSARIVSTKNVRLITTYPAMTKVAVLNRAKEFKTEKGIVYLDDPDTFGTIGGHVYADEPLVDEDDKKEEEFLKNKPLPQQKLTIRQYAELIKQYLKNKQLMEAIDVLEHRMLVLDRVQPENYIYNILIGACAELGYTKQAFKLYNDMKRRGLKPTGDTYTCLFEACSNSAHLENGLKTALRLKEIIEEKGIELNLTNYNTMIKAFGRCGDLPSAFRIVDEMVSKKIKIRVHTFNHLLQACISDKEHGLRHALIVWRKMLTAKEKPNIYSFNLILKCVKECNLGKKSDIEELLKIIQQHVQLAEQRAQKALQKRVLQIESSHKNKDSHIYENEERSNLNHEENTFEGNKVDFLENINTSSMLEVTDNENNQLAVSGNNNALTTQDKKAITFQLIENRNIKTTGDAPRNVPNLLSKVLQMNQVLSLREITTTQEKFAIVGGQEDFLREMAIYSVDPDVKTFTQMLFLIEDSAKAELKLLDALKKYEVRVDIDFYNMLIKKRCYRLDYDGAFEVLELIKQENKLRKKKHPAKKKIQLKLNIITYGVLAMACKDKELAENLLNEMRERRLKINIEILGAMLRQGTAQNSFIYVQYIMDVVLEENLHPNKIFLRHLEMFHEKNAYKIRQNKSGNNLPESFIQSYKEFVKSYNKWLKQVNVEEILKPEDPWKQFQEPYPETFQRNKDMEVVEPKKFYKQNRKYVKYVPRV